ncbi:MAG: hypothetical protein ABI766_03835 [Gemmatimonadales bacterium]
MGATVMDQVDRLRAALGTERFLREIRIEARLEHPNILPLFESGAADGDLYYVMPYIEGETLKERIRNEKARAQRQFFLGQACCMNADDISWVHLSKGGVSSGGLQARNCHPSGPLNRTPCPALAFDVPHGKDQ